MMKPVENSSSMVSKKKSVKHSEKSASSKGKSARKSARKKKKIQLDRGKVNLFCGVIFLLCSLCLAWAILFQSPDIAKTPSAEKNMAAEGAPSYSENGGLTVRNVQETASKKRENISAEAEIPRKSESVPAEKKNSTSVKSVQPSTPQTQKKNDAPKTETDSKKSVTAESSTENAGKSEFNIPPAKNGATIVLILDDAGMSAENTKKYTSLPFPLTVAVLPKLPQTKECAEVVRSSGKELILHQPMQSLNQNLDPGPGKINARMSFSEIRSIVNGNLAELGGGVKGMNNHEGSEVTEDVLRIGAVLDVCLENGIYFLDSRTSANSAAKQAALERDMRIFEKSGPFIDNEISRQAMLKELYKTLDFANSRGVAIIIAHVDKSVKILPELLLRLYPHLKEAGYAFATPSMLKVE